MVFEDKKRYLVIKNFFYSDNMVKILLKAQFEKTTSWFSDFEFPNNVITVSACPKNFQPQIEIEKSVPTKL